MSESEEEDDFDVGALPLQLASLDDLAKGPVNKDGSEVHVVFLVDTSRSMGTEDVETSTRGCAPIVRLDAVLHAILEYLHAQDVTDAVSAKDSYSVCLFNSFKTTYLVKPCNLDTCQRRLRQKCRYCKLRTCSSANYIDALSSIQERPTQVRPLRVVMLSDGRPQSWNDNDVGKLQDWIEEMCKHGPCEVHTIGFGIHLQHFEVLQQVAQLCGGNFQLAGLSMCNLNHAFTSVSQSVTTTRIRSSGYKIPSAPRIERSVRYGMPYPWLNGSRPDKGCIKMQCLRLAYTWNVDDSAVQLDESSTLATSISRRPKPHAKGNMRIVYAINDYSIRERMVSKESKYTEVDLDNEVKSFVSSSCAAQYFAAEFCKELGAAFAGRITFLSCYLYQYTTDEAVDGCVSCFCGEHFLPGVFVKWVGNHGFINRVDSSDLIEALCHYTYHVSKGKLMVADLQGVQHNGFYILTDPQLLSHDERFGRADLGGEGMRKFLEQHNCNSFCVKLGLGLQKLHDRRASTSSMFKPAPRLGTLLGERLSPLDLFKKDDGIRRLVFVGECTLSFCKAAATLVGRRACDAPWLATELNFPAQGATNVDLRENKAYLQSVGVHVMTMNAHIPTWDNAQIPGIEGAIWAMPYPPEFDPGHLVPSAIQKRMQNIIFDYVKAMIPKLVPGGSVSVVLLSKQHLNWGLRESIETSVGIARPEMRVLALQPLIDKGYRPRYGDARDQMKKADYHLLCEAVCVQWRVTTVESCGGMTDTRLKMRLVSGR